jgi:hypothetical protein
MSRYVFHPEAEDELMDEIRYHEKRRKGLGKSFLAEVRKTIRISVPTRESAHRWTNT